MIQDLAALLAIALLLVFLYLSPEQIAYIGTWIEAKVKGLLSKRS